MPNILYYDSDGDLCSACAVQLSECNLVGGKAALSVKILYGAMPTTLYFTMDSSVSNHVGQIRDLVRTWYECKSLDLTAYDYVHAE